jgi:predicted nucleotidyltransferase
MNIREKVKEHLKEIEMKHEVKIIHAIESGSRSWGFPSPDSDFDVRFIYVHRKDWYLQVFAERDVIEVPISDELDIAGWDLKKTMYLAAKGNVVVHEWLNTPIIYQSHTKLYNELKSHIDKSFNSQAAFHHYRSMAKRALHDVKEQKEVKLKRFFYFMRALLSARWILRNNSMPSVEFEYLLLNTDIEPNYIEEIKNLIVLKSNMMESERLVIDEKLINYVETLFGNLSESQLENTDLQQQNWNQVLANILKLESA